jgi:spore coat polysaccharide biosynthesis predicted glycosyltransferase SpsG
MINNLYILTEGSISTGLGHITRCLSVYQNFVNYNIQPLLIIDADESISYYIENFNFVCFNWKIEQEKLFHIINDADFVLIDSYLADLALYGKIAELVPLVGYIDDNKRIEYPKGIIINNNLNAEKIYSYEHIKYFKCFLGIKYLLLRNEFLKYKSFKRSAKKQPENILVLLGGSNLSVNYLFECLKAFLNIRQGLFSFKLVLGNINQKNVINQIDLSNIDIEVISMTNGIAELMLWADLGINAMGITSIEMLWMQLPFISVQISDEQNVYSEEYRKNGIYFFDKHEVLLNTLLFLSKEDNFKKYFNNFQHFRKNLNDLNLANYLLNE